MTTQRQPTITSRRLVAAPERNQNWGVLSRRRLVMSGCTNPSDCDRVYHLYLPSSLCNGAKEDKDLVRTTTPKFPLVIGLHGFRGNATNLFTPWTPYADHFGYVLAIPEGVEKSWNGNVCCGYALERRLDDVGFLRRLIATLANEFPYSSPKLVYGVGQSNGAFLITKAARLFRAIAPSAGYQYYDNANDTLAAQQIKAVVPKSTPIFMHHSKNDGIVKFTGCCQNEPPCCCQISQYSSQCTPAYKAFDQWARHVNACGATTTDSNHPELSSSSLTVESPTVSTITSMSFKNTSMGVTCHTGMGCRANSTICVYEHSGHFNPYSKKAPMRKEISEFFMKHACEEYYHGEWKIIENDTPRCLVTGKETQSDSSVLPNDMDQVSNGRRAVTIGTFGILALVLLVWRGRRRRVLRDKSGWKRVPAGEVEFS